MSGSIVYVEHANGAADRVSLESIALARSLGGPVEAVVAGGPSAGLAGVAASLSAHGVSAVHVAEDARLDAFAPEALGAVIAQVVKSGSPGAVLGPGTERGNEVLSHAAARLALPLAANVMTVSADAGGWRLSRQRWAGSLIEDARLEASVGMFTVAPHTTAVAEVAGAPAAVVTSFTPNLTDRDLRVRVTGREPAAEGSISLTDAKVVVGGGRGVGSAERFDELEELAGLLGAALGVSRVVTSNGWKPHTMQIGQTGQRIAPDLYIACGISGAIQHIVGCKAAKRILAINTDPEAPIMGRAAYAVIGDLHQVVPAISAAIRQRSSTS
ncbi:MAG TPA: electron transfer flavoprotein subunit alpha/FixB family protein [Candidatus Polarisedimenticolia bacterium]|nr:electron transfer flavoprotein subunit alpha/FixB family protein [Candidatus Polarisedimenticolia bacterium]